VRKVKTSLITIIAIGLLAGSTAGVAAQDENAPAPPQPFTGVIDCGHLVAAGTWRIVNEEGAWQGSYHNFDTPGGEDVVVTVPLTSEDAYDGLTAIWEASNFDDDHCWDVRGLIIEGELPAYPEPPAE